MSDNEIKILVTADVRAFQKEMKAAGTSSKDLQKQSTRFRKEGVKGSKDIQKTAQLIQKGQKKQLQEAIALEKKLQLEIKNTAKAMRLKAEASNGNVDAIQHEMAAIKKLESEILKSRKMRGSLGHQSLEERIASHRQGNAETRRQGRSMGGWALNGAIGVAGMIGGAVLNRATQSYEAAERYEITRGGLTGLGRESDFNPSGGQRFGYSMTDTAQGAGAAARATGNLGAVGQSQALSRALGMDMGESTSIMSVLRSSGHQFTGADGSGGGGADQLKKIIAAGFESGLERARVPEFIEAVGGLVGTAQAALSSKVDAGGYSALMAMLGRSGQPGMQGGLGAGVVSKLDSSIKNPGGGDAGRALISQALGFGNPGGGGVDYYTMEKQREKGASDPQNVMDMLRSVNSRTGGNEQEANLMLREMTGLGLEQIETIQQSLSGGNAGGALEQIRTELAAAKPVEEQALDQMKEMGHAIERVAKLENDLIRQGIPLVQNVQKIADAINMPLNAMVKMLADPLDVIAEAVVDLRDLFVGDPTQQTSPIARATMQVADARSTVAGIPTDSAAMEFVTTDEFNRLLEQSRGDLIHTRQAIETERGAIPSMGAERGGGYTPEERAGFAQQRQHLAETEAFATRLAAISAELNEVMRARMTTPGDTSDDTAHYRTLAALVTAAGAPPTRPTTGTRR